MCAHTHRPESFCSPFDMLNMVCFCCCFVLCVCVCDIGYGRSTTTTTTLMIFIYFRTSGCSERCMMCATLRVRVRATRPFQFTFRRRAFMFNELLLLFDFEYNKQQREEKKLCTMFVSIVRPIQMSPSYAPIYIHGNWRRRNCVCTERNQTNKERKPTVFVCPKTSLTTANRIDCYWNYVFGHCVKIWKLYVFCVARLGVAWRGVGEACHEATSPVFFCIWTIRAHVVRRTIDKRWWLMPHLHRKQTDWRNNIQYFVVCGKWQS